MLKFLKSNGLKKINFIIINSANSSTYFNKLIDNVNNNDVKLFQDTESIRLWNLLEGKNYDIFVYNRCGKIAYHISYPLSILDPNEPIVQGTLQATYYEDLCNGCYQNSETDKQSNTKIQYNHQLENDNKNHQPDYNSRTGREENVGETIDNSKINEKIDVENRNSNIKNLNNEKIQLNQTINSLKSNSTIPINKSKEFYLSKGEILKNSNSTLNASDIFIENIDKDDNNKFNNNDGNNTNSSYLFFSPWQLLKFFVTKSRTFNYNLTEHQNLTSLTNEIQLNNSTINNNQTLINNQLSNQLNTISFNSPTQINSSNLSTTIKYHQLESNHVKSSENSTMNSDLIGVKKCTVPELNCSDYSIDKMLSVRLCCLNSSQNNLLAGGFQCKKFDKEDCNKVLPIIKCCLRELSEILDDYFAKTGSSNLNNSNNNISNNT